MHNIEAIVIRVKELSEIELESFMKEVGDHMTKHNLEHIINNVFEMDKDDTINELQEERDDLKQEVRDLKKYKYQIEAIKDII